MRKNLKTDGKNKKIIDFGTRTAQTNLKKNAGDKIDLIHLQRFRKKRCKLKSSLN